MNNPLNGNSTQIKDYVYQHQRTNPYFFAFGECNNNTCNNDKGHCINTAVCMCKDGWAQQKDTEDNGMCNYKMKDQLTAFLLELIFIVGIGHLYCGRILHGIFKLIFWAAIIVCDILFRCVFKSYNWKTRKCINLLFFILYIIAIFGHTLDIMMFAMNKYKDGKHMPLYCWGNPKTNI